MPDNETSKDSFVALEEQDREAKLNALEQQSNEAKRRIEELLREERMFLQLCRVTGKDAEAAVHFKKDEELVRKHFVGIEIMEDYAQFLSDKGKFDEALKKQDYVVKFYRFKGDLENMNRAILEKDNLEKMVKEAKKPSLSSDNDILINKTLFTNGQTSLFVFCKKTGVELSCISEQESVNLGKCDTLKDLVDKMSNYPENAVLADKIHSASKVLQKELDFSKDNSAQKDVKNEVKKESFKFESKDKGKVNLKDKSASKTTNLELK